MLQYINQSNLFDLTRALLYNSTELTAKESKKRLGRQMVQHGQKKVMDKCELTRSGPEAVQQTKNDDTNKIWYAKPCERQHSWDVQTWQKHIVRPMFVSEEVWEQPSQHTASI